MYYADCSCMEPIVLKKGEPRKLRFRNISMRNWKQWSPVVTRTMRTVFPRGLWWTAENFTDSMKSEDCIARLATIDRAFAGFSLGHYDRVPDKALGKISKRKVIHLYYIFLDSPYHHGGYGYLLLKDFVQKSQTQGYRTLTVFAKIGPSVKNLQKLGARPMKVFEDFYGTGDTYIFCALDLAH